METRKLIPWVRAAVLVVGALLLAGCTPFARQTPTPPTGAGTPSPPKAERVQEERPAADLVHTVRWKGESLSIIAKWYTGETKNWRLLAEHNPLKDPDRIGIGDRIAIPEPLLRTREPLPRDFVRRHAPAPRKGGPPEGPEPDGPEPEEASPEPLPDEAPELFGPKELKGE